MIATTLEQSRKLVELGINPNTADMHYAFTVIGGDVFQDMVDNSAILLTSNHNTKYPYEPAWSLAALLEIMPDATSITVGTLSNGNKYYYCDAYDYLTPAHDTPIDAAVDMVCWLKENKYI